ncbi:MAG: type ISP restriction/modification enzyme [Promethearchaeota archaeon]
MITNEDLLNKIENYGKYLKNVDPITAKEKGVVYTPEKIVDFMIGSIDFLLSKFFNLKIGIRTEKNLKYLDPASGTNTFACGLLKFAKKKFLDENSNLPSAQSAFDKWVKNGFLNNIYLIEIMKDPYLLGYLRILSTLDKLGMNLKLNDLNLNSSLSNTFLNPNYMKKNDPKEVFIIMGNPPYNLSSQNNCAWINEKIMDYKNGLKERNKKIISDDYVKFLRFGQWKIKQAGKGILAMITNNRYLEGQMFSVMRESLRKTFDHIYIVNLHGDMRKKEAGNPFDIRIGVCVAFMVRIDNSPNKNAAIHYMDVPNLTREEKFLVLSKGFHENSFKMLSETKKNYFVDIDTELLDRYEFFPSIDSFFVSSPTSGIMVGKDHLLVDTDRKNVETNLKLFFNKDFGKLNELKIKTHDSKSWKKDKVFAKTSLTHAISKITPIQYRGFDFRYIAYDRSIVEGHRMGYIDQISQKNPAITVSKSSRKSNFCTAFIANQIIEKCHMSVTDTSYAFLLNKDGKSNIDKKSSRIPFNCSDEELFYYNYGILFSMTYRKRYDEYLLKGFPRIPITKNRDLFIKMSELGYRLAQTHLLNMNVDPKLDVAEIPPDQWIVKDFYYSPEEECLYFDKTKLSWIKGITLQMWEFSIGNIPQLPQFLKSRKYSSVRKWNTLQRSLTHEELIVFLKICSAIEITLKLLPYIDEIYKKIDILE